ncbi:chemotaxis response regulator protein-glutamate methylesterase, partial [Xylella fastidiosa subsp. multiplex]|nr:chemotaxis response regulator protein-glutamate methylesterase [Xylella fastidiosa subsp. multiplex]
MAGLSGGKGCSTSRMASVPPSPMLRRPLSSSEKLVIVGASTGG